MKLNVAIADSDDLVFLKVLNVEPVLVSKSLMELQEIRRQASDQLKHMENQSDSVHLLYIDFRTNKVVLGLSRQFADSARSALSLEEFSGAIEIVEEEANFVLSSGAFRAADETRNLTWQQIPGGVWPCSIGAPVEGGYVTAGHCGYANNSIGDATNESLGVVQESEWANTFTGPDVGYVETVAGWTPTAQVNGYTDGNFDISAEWGGTVEYPVGSTLCRYGQTTGGPNCSTLDQLDVDIQYSSTQTITGMSIVDGSCTSRGDSGGTWVAGTGQIQGIHSGGVPFNIGDWCPTTFEYLFFQPIRDALDEYNVTMLTSHGSSAPSITSVSCPNMTISGQGLYQCLLKNVDSQGEVGIQWTTSTGASSTGLWVMDNCTSLQMVTVTLKATNPYGTTTKNYSFRCPSGPIQ